ncbi:MAG: hypothetical protein K2N58_01870 [Treponemataceae bacterium]|nr:hypothetical protein [Treponemataceae bacterium]
MKKKLGILGLVAIMLLSFNACDNGSTSSDDKKGQQTSDPSNPNNPNGPNGSTGSDDTTEDYEDMLDYAVRLFEDLDIDGGIKQINKAYANTKNDTTKMYYALARLACISTNADTVKFMRETCGFESYPNKLNALIDANWWEDCVKEGFAEKVAKANPNGLNKALDELLKIFTATYNEVVEISKGMGQSTVTLPAKLIEAFELEELFDTSDIRAGKAELDVVIAAMGLAKGGLEYVSAFDWTFDTSSIKTNMDVDDFVKAVQSGTKLLTTTNKERLALSKKSFIDAVNLAMSSYDYIIGDNNVYPAEIKDTLKEGNIFYKAAKAFKDALEKGGTFCVPDADVFELKDWPTSESDDWLLKIDCGKLFSDGVLDKAVEKDSGKVKFYTTCDWWYEYYDGNTWKYDDSYDDYEAPLAGSFYSVHEKNVKDVKAQIPENATSSYWRCSTDLAIKIRLPDCITIKGMDEKERETILPIWGERTREYD